MSETLKISNFKPRSDTRIQCFYPLCYYCYFSPMPFLHAGNHHCKNSRLYLPFSEYLLSTLWEILICCGERYYCLSFQVTSNTYLQLLKSMKCCCVCHPSLHAHAIPPVLLVICLMSGLMCSDRIKEWACAPKCTLCNN